jgi:dihydroorotate dehydrogenase
MSDSRFAGEPGGLSGAPLTARALSVVRRITAATTLPVIGVGGIMTADDAEAMFDAGARLVQVYTGFIFAGPALVAGINALEAR